MIDELLSEREQAERAMALEVLKEIGVVDDGIQWDAEGLAMAADSLCGFALEFAARFATPPAPYMSPEDAANREWISRNATRRDGADDE